MLHDYDLTIRLETTAAKPERGQPGPRGSSAISLHGVKCLTMRGGSFGVRSDLGKPLLFNNQVYF